MKNAKKVAANGHGGRSRSYEKEQNQCAHYKEYQQKVEEDEGTGLSTREMPNNQQKARQHILSRWGKLGTPTVSLNNKFVQPRHAINQGYRTSA